MGILGLASQRPLKTGVPPEKRLSKEAVTTIVIHGFFQLGASMSGTFLTLYLWRLTEDLFVNGLYALISYLIGPIAFAVAGRYAKTRDRLFTYRLGIALTALFYLFVIAAGTRVVDYFYLFALMGGTAGAFYWLGYLTLTYDVSTDGNRIRYLGLNSIVFNLAGLIGPAVSGWIITMSGGGLEGYTTVFIVAFLMFVVTTLGSFRLRAMGSHHKAYYLNLMPLVFRKDAAFRHCLIGWLFLGAYQAILMLLPNILLYQAFKQEAAVGYAGVVLLGLTIATSYLLSRRGKEALAKRYCLSAAAAFSAGSAVLVCFGVQTWSVLVFVVLYYACVPLLINSFSAYHYRLVGQLPLKGNLRVETVVARETFINGGRVIGLLALILLSDDLNSPMVPLVLFGAALLQFNFAWIIKKR